MVLNGPLADTEIHGNILIELACQNTIHNLTLTVSERCKALFGIFSPN
jgi:hypothetical protein